MCSQQDHYSVFNPFQFYSCPKNIVPRPQTKILRKAEKLLVQEEEEKRIERENTLKQNAPPLKLTGLSVQELQVLDGVCVCV